MVWCGVVVKHKCFLMISTFQKSMTGRDPSLILTIENGLGSSSVVKFKFKFNRFLSPVLHHQPSYIFTEAFGIIHFTFCFVLHQIFRLEYVSEIPGYLADKNPLFPPVMLCYVNNNM